MASGPEHPERLRVALLGDKQTSWGSLLGGSNSIELIAADDPGALTAGDVDLLIGIVRPDDAAELATRLAGQSDPPAATLYVGETTDDHPQARLVEILVHGKREWEGTFDAIVDPVALLDADGAVIRANVGFANVVGKKIQELVPRALNIRDLLGGPEDGEADPIARSLEDAEQRTEETRYKNLPGIQQVTTSPLHSEHGEPHRLVVLLKDVADWKEQQERLLQAARLADIGLLAAGVAHEINTPLASIALRAESLLRSAEDPRLQAIDSFKNFQRYLKTIDEEIFRCKKIIGALLEFSRSRKPEIKEVDINTIAEKAADLVSHQMKLKQIALGLRLDPKLPAIEADEGQLRQALIALLMNALDATPAQGKVEIETRREAPTQVSLSVSDDGGGIPRDILDKIFSPFFTTKPLGKGTGLGLAICHGIVTSHGGEIRVDSEVGKGTRFSLVLPIHGEKAAPSSGRKRRSASAKG